MKIPSWAQFDAGWYRLTYGGRLGELASTSSEELEAHYRETGQREGWSPNRFFDEEWYLAAHPDVAAAVRAGTFASGFEHYRADGFRSRSPHWLFSESQYLARYPDLTRSALDRLGLVNGYDHYLSVGDREFRSGHLFFDPHLYYAKAVVAPAGEGEPAATRIPEIGPFADFLTDLKQGTDLRVSWYFDPEWYLRTYPDVAQTLEGDAFSSALHHFLTNPTPRQYGPLEWFEEDYYLELYPDIEDAITSGFLRSGYDHFVRYGVFERRKPHPDIDLNAYFFSGTVRADIERGLVRDVFVHWLSRRHVRPLDEGVERPPLEQFETLARRKAEALLPLLTRHPLDFTRQGAARLGVVLMAHNRLPLTLAALSALHAACGETMQVVVVDCGSQDDTRRLHHFVTGVKVVRLGQTATRAEALQAALPHLHAPDVLWLGQGMTLRYGALDAALAQLAEGRATGGAERVGLVTGRVMRADGRLWEAGAIAWRDGSLARYMEGARLEAPEVSFRRQVPCGTAPAMLIDRALLEQLAGFDEAFGTQAFQLADLCLRAAALGRRTLYEPSLIVSNDAHEPVDDEQAQVECRLLRRRHARHLDTALPPSPVMVSRARSVRPSSSSRRILFIEDRIPTRRLGSGFVRSNDIVRTMAALGHEVTVFPIYSSTDPLPVIHRDFPVGVEVLHDRGFEHLEAFLQARSGMYDGVWIGRTHNVGRMLPVLLAQAQALPIDALVLDTEAVTAPRDALRAKLFDLPLTRSVADALEDELSSAWLCQTIVAVNPLDARILREAGHEHVAELGHMCPLRPTPAGWGERRDMLFLGAIHEANSPNHDSLVWFVNKVLPLLRDRLPEGVRFTVAGYLGAGVDLSALGHDPRVELVGPVKDPAALYASHRIFVAPTRFAGGIPFKIHEAASHGLPVVASQLLCRQLGWRDGMEIISGGDNDPQVFADRVVALYEDRDLWDAVRAGALAVLADENSEKAYSVRLNAILQDVFERAQAAQS
ncbi:hypothetical protein AA0472_1735 [Acetobacter estunensis NRIC 0472]|uniref:Glycosyltransferase n=1 Tax=Acetobacter estunensis TaxID=104097 RepID=A0A967BAH3_9PROT|nr:glycosyltransferase [Acetobacter estunensis]NHO54961.1 glycosyltransferase [Acetobacter estunensis]GBQ25369.1 hypothetical protein AA0472_1735 [Acetobacter estunensis NRIC 0472]